MDNLYKKRLNSILPPSLPGTAKYRDYLVEEQSRKDAGKLTAKELAKRLSDEKHKLKALTPGTKEAAISGLKVKAMESVIEAAPDILAPRTNLQGELPKETHATAPENIPLENPYLTASPEDQSPTPHVDKVIDAMTSAPATVSPAPSTIPPAIPFDIPSAYLNSLKGATRPEVAKLMQTLNINLDVALSKKDTADLLAALLTCNETQLEALEKNKKVPVVVKIVIKRIKEDLKNGSLTTIDYLWDRIFGKDSFNAPAAGTAPDPLSLTRSSIRQGHIPDVPVSREAYILIRDTLIK